MPFENTPIPPAPQEPRVHNPIPAVLLLLLGVGNLVAAFFPRTSSELELWWASLLSAVLFLGLSAFLFVRFRRESQAHAKWEKDVATWKNTSQALERQLMETQLERERLELQRIKTQVVGEHSACRSQTEEYAVAGTSYRQDVIKSLGTENFDYSLTKREILADGREDEHLDKYFFDPLPVSLEKDPDNPHGDGHAVKVLLSGEHVGYIPADSSSHVTELIDKGLIDDLDAEIVGGPYKYYDSLEETIVKENLNFGVRLTIYLK